jgi:hypothetical protein
MKKSTEPLGPDQFPPHPVPGDGDAKLGFPRRRSAVAAVPRGRRPPATIPRGHHPPRSRPPLPPPFLARADSTRAVASNSRAATSTNPPGRLQLPPPPPPIPAGGRRSRPTPASSTCCLSLLRPRRPAVALYPSLLRKVRML